MVEDAALATAPAGDARPAQAAMPADGPLAAIAGTGATDAADAAPAAQETLFGTLEAEQRVRAAAEQNERTLWAGAVGVTLVYVSIIAAQVFLGGGILS